MQAKTKQFGRPPAVDPIMHTAGVGLRRTELYTIRNAAAAAGLSVSAYLRRKLGLDKEVEG